MLKMKKKITLDGYSTVEDVRIMGFKAEIDNENPENMTLTSWIIDKDACKEHRVLTREDRANFEDTAYAIQDELIVEIQAAE